MKKEITMGKNRTGMDMSPVELPLLDAAQAAPSAAQPGNGGGVSGTELPMVQ